MIAHCFEVGSATQTQTVFITAIKNQEKKKNHDASRAIIRGNKPR